MNTESCRIPWWARPAALHAALAVAIMSAFATAPASAGDGAKNDGLLQVRVKYAVVELQSDAGALNVYRRIAAAARVVCPDDNSRDLRYLQAVSACRRVAIDRAVREAGSERLAAIHAARMAHTRVA